MFSARRGSRDITRRSLVVTWMLATCRSYRVFISCIAVCMVLCSFVTLQYASYYHSNALVVFNSSLKQALLMKATTSKATKSGVSQQTIKDLYRNRKPSFVTVQPTRRKTPGISPGAKRKVVKDLSKTKKTPIDSSDAKTEYPVTLYAPYLMENPTLCSSVSHLKVLVIVHTAPGHFERRMNMRRTWTNSTHLKSLDGELRTLFLLGRVADSKIQTKLDEEFNQYKDMVQGDFIDAYRNLSHKGVLGYKWVAERCKNAQFVLKVDDDVIVNTYKLFNVFLPRFENKNKQIFCNHIIPGTMRIIRDKKSKWYVDEKYFKGQKYYPRYCSGFMVLIKNDAIPAIYRSASMTPLFWVDDVYLYGLVPSGVPGMKYNNLKKKHYELTELNAVKCYKNATRTCDFVVTGGKKPHIVNDIWSFMVNQSAKTTTLSTQKVIKTTKQ